MGSHSFHKNRHKNTPSSAESGKMFIVRINDKRLNMYKCVNQIRRFEEQTGTDSHIVLLVVHDSAVLKKKKSVLYH
jgi:hypothetical protein